MKGISKKYRRDRAEVEGGRKVNEIKEKVVESRRKEVRRKKMRTMRKVERRRKKKRVRSKEEKEQG
jgi:hypothetical protein